MKSVLSGFALVMAFFLAGTVPVQAHGSEPSFSDPAMSAVLDKAPSSILLEFPEKMKQSGAAVSVLAPDGSQLVEGEAAVADNIMSATLKPSNFKGVYKVAYTMIFEDGAALKGGYDFEVTQGEVPSVSSDAPDSTLVEATPSEEPAVNPSAASSNEATAKAAVSQETANEKSEGLPPLVWILAAAGATLLLGSALWPKSE